MNRQLYLPVALSLLVAGCATPVTFQSDRLEPEHRTSIKSLRVLSPTGTNTVFAIQPKASAGALGTGAVAGGIVAGALGALIMGPMMMELSRDLAVFSGISNKTVSVQPIEGVHFDGRNKMVEAVRSGLRDAGYTLETNGVGDAGIHFSGPQSPSQTVNSSEANLSMHVDSYGFVKLPKPPTTMTNAPYVPRVMVGIDLSGANRTNSLYSRVFWNLDLASDNPAEGLPDTHFFKDANQIKVQGDRATEALNLASEKITQDIIDSLTVHPVIVYFHRLDENLWPVRIELDGKPFAKISWRTCMLRTIPTGKHTLTFAQIYPKSFLVRPLVTRPASSVEIEAEAGKVYHVDCSAQLKMAKLLPEKEGAKLVEAARKPQWGVKEQPHGGGVRR